MMERRKRWGRLACTLLAFFLAAAAGAEAREYRSLRRIPTPDGAAREGQAVVVIRPVAPEVVRAAVEQIYETYNTPRFYQALSRDFYDAGRLTDAVYEKVPRDARLRVLSIQGMQTFDQRIVASAGGGSDILVSTVSVTVRAQMEFTEDGRFQRREGVNEHILRIYQKRAPQ